MPIKITHIKDQLVSLWSGGTSTQLYIQPVGTIFEDRKFDLRISTASITQEFSDFTPFTGYTRKLKVLEGNLTIDHENQYSKDLIPFDQDQFSGDWKTKGKGIITDFNVIFKPGIDVILYHIEFDPGEKLILLNTNMKFIYVYKGNGSINEQKVIVQDFIEINEEEEIHFEAEIHSILIVVEIR